MYYRDMPCVVLPSNRVTLSCVLLQQFKFLVVSAVVGILEVFQSLNLYCELMSNLSPYHNYIVL